MPNDDTSADHNKVLLGILALLAADRDERIEDEPPRRSEIVLAEAGFTPQEIAKLTGRKAGGGSEPIRRAQSKKTS